MEADLFLDGDATAAPPRWRQALGALHPTAWLTTLKARLAAGALAALLIGMALTTWHMASVAQKLLLVQAQEREQASAQRLAAIVGHRVAELQRALRVTAARMDAKTLHASAPLFDFLQAQPALRAIFSDVFVAGADGRLLMFFDADGSRIPTTSIADREYFQRTMSTGAATLSAPLTSVISGEPVVIFSQPLGIGGSVQGIIAGALHLASNDPIEGMAKFGNGDDGALVVITDATGTILSHPLGTRLLASLNTEPRLSDALQLSSRQGHAPPRDAGVWAGKADIVAMATVPGTGWHLWRATSTAALLAPLRQAHARALTTAALLAAVLAAALVAFMAWQLRPLVRLERRASELLNGDAQDDWPQAQGEIGQLARTLRHVWAERAQADRFNAQVLRKLSSVMGAAPVGLAFIRDQRFELVSAECCKLLGRSEEELVGAAAQIVFASNEHYHATGPQMQAAFDLSGTFTDELQMIRADGSLFWARLLARPVLAGDKSEGSIWSLFDASDQIVNRHRLEHAASHDPLTGVLNRKGFEHVLASAFDGRSQARPSSVVMIDLDHFKPINDTAGHAAGDAMLKAVAQAIAANVRASDTVARLGGDEFALVLPGCEQARAIVIAEKVRRAVTVLCLAWEGHRLQVGASLGVAELAEHHETFAAWLADADGACYEAKRSGRGAIRAAAKRAALEPVAVGARTETAHSA